jgi:hypothetical protein
MSVVSVELSFNGTTGGRKKNAAEYTAAYKVDTDSVLDQTATICDHFKNAGNLPYLDSPYVYANDNDPAAVCTGIDPRREAKSATRWIVTLKYETPSSEDKKNDNNQQGRDSDGKLTNDPLMWADDIDVSFTQITVPVEGATYWGGYKGSTAAVMKPGMFGPVMNSAFIPFVPPPETSIHIAVVRRSFYHRDFDQDLASTILGKVNSNDMTFNRLGYKGSWRKTTAKCIEYGGTLEFINGFYVWRNRVEIHISPAGWRRFILDRGLHARAMPGDADGHGGTISALDLRDGAPSVRRIMDVSGVPISEPVLFDGDGGPLIEGGVVPSAVYGLWAIDPEIPFPNNIMG